jgi:hypothetical protein
MYSDHSRVEVMEEKEEGGASGNKRSRCEGFASNGVSRWCSLISKCKWRQW